MAELELCPFCGSEAETLTADSMHGGYWFGIMCNDCRSRGDVYDNEAEAIAAWNARAGRGTLTAEQVRKVLLYHLPHREYYSVEQTDAWQAIADELNATLGGGECSIEERNGDWYCVGCGEMVGTCDTASELYIDGNAVELWSYCPRCGKAVKR